MNSSPEDPSTPTYGGRPNGIRGHLTGIPCDLDWPLAEIANCSAWGQHESEVWVGSSVCSKAGNNLWTTGNLYWSYKCVGHHFENIWMFFVEVASNTLEADTEGFIQPQWRRTCLSMFKLLPSLQGCGTNKQTRLSGPEYHLSISYCPWAAINMYPATLKVCQVQC